MESKEEEGWYTDPYDRHQARWLSDGIATKLVRDGDVESYDDPPVTPPTQTPVRLEAQTQSGSDDLKRVGAYPDPNTKPHTVMSQSFFLGEWSRQKPKS